MSNPFQKFQIVKLFASSEYKTRNKAYKSVISLLKLEYGLGKKQLSENDIISIWKGLYIWLWMQDKPILHEEVVTKIANLLTLISSPTVAMEFMKGFYITMNREWSKIDAYRLDKFYMLVRDFFAATLQWHIVNDWKNIDEYVAIINESLILPSKGSCMGVKLHFVDLLLDELMKADVCELAVTKLISMIILSLRSKNCQDIYNGKVNKRIITRLQRLAKENKLKIDLESLGKVLFESAGKDEMKSKCRKLFYSLSKQFVGLTGLINSGKEGQIKESEEQKNDLTTNIEMEVDNEKDEINEELVLSDFVTDRIETFLLANDVVNDDNNNNDDDGVVVVVCQEPDKCEDMEMIEGEKEMIEGEKSPINNNNNNSTKKSSKTADKKTKRKKSKNHLKESPACESPSTKIMNMLRENHEKATSDGEDNRRVTFGKRYTKKFTKSTTTIKVSQCTVKQQEIKSILKHK